MPKKSVQEARDLVAEARARIAEEEQRAQALAEAERIVAEAEAERAAAERKNLLDRLLGAYAEANDAYEEEKDSIFAGSFIDFVKGAKRASDLRSQAEAARLSLLHQVKPNGYLADENESEYDVAPPTRAEVRLAPGVAGDAALKGQIEALGLDPQAVRGLLTQPGISP